MKRLWLVLVGSLAGLTSSCESPVESQCHRDVVERYGCCPSCDAECRAALSQECAATHDEPLTLEGVTTGGSSSGPDPEDDEPTPG